MQVLLCGTNYGASYAQALWSQPAGMRLAGILSRGSERSRALARQLGTSHFSALHDVIAGSIDAAIVAVPGIDGVELVMALLKRGVHVLAEHPWEPEALEKALAAARAKNLVLHVNSHFADLESVDQFLRHANRGAQLPPIFVNLAVNARTLYSSIDIVGRLLFPNAPRPVQFTPANPSAADPSAPAFFATIHGVVANVPVAIHCQRYSSAVDDGLATFVNHQIILGFMDGNLMLGDTFGPSLWVPRIMPQTQWAHTAWTLLSPPPNESAGAYGAAVRDRANRAACERFAAQIGTGEAAAAQRPEYLVQVSRTWRTALDSLWGPAES